MLRTHFTGLVRGVENCAPRNFHFGSAIKALHLDSLLRAAFILRIGIHAITKNPVHLEPISRAAIGRSKSWRTSPRGFFRRVLEAVCKNSSDEKEFCCWTKICTSFIERFSEIRWRAEINVWAAPISWNCTATDKPCNLEVTTSGFFSQRP